jgi:hypothetical protein
MGVFLLIILGFAVFLFLAFKLIMAYTMKVTSWFVENKHRDAEEILQTGYVPVRWMSKKEMKGEVEESGFKKTNSLRKLTKIIKYFEHTPLVEDEESRKILLTRLRAIRAQWKQARWTEMLPPTGRPFGF